MFYNQYGDEFETEEELQDDFYNNVTKDEIIERIFDIFLNEKIFDALQGTTDGEKLIEDAVETLYEDYMANAYKSEE